MGLEITVGWKLLLKFINVQNWIMTIWATPSLLFEWCEALSNRLAELKNFANLVNVGQTVRINQEE